MCNFGNIFPKSKSTEFGHKADIIPSKNRYISLAKQKRWGMTPLQQKGKKIQNQIINNNNNKITNKNKQSK
jgi:hypothetical protein